MRRLILGLAICLMLCLSLTACGSQKNIDSEAYKNISGEYQAAEQSSGNDEDYVGSWWHLSIGEDESGHEYLSIYDNGAGNPGISGEIVTLTDEELVISYDEDMFEELPSARWKTGDGQLAMTYELTERGIELTNNEHTILFKKEGLPEIISCHWKAPESKQLDNILFENDQVCLEGWNMNDDGVWDDVPTSYFLAESCSYVDNLTGGGEVSCEEFQRILKGDGVEYSVIELEVVNGEVTALRLIGPDESRFTE